MSKEETAAAKKKRLAEEEKLRLAEEEEKLNDFEEIQVDLICTTYHEDSDADGNKVCFRKGDVIEGLSEEQAYRLVERKKAVYVPTEQAE